MEKHALRWWALAVVVPAVLVDMIDNQIVAVALPTIQRELGTGESALQWISAGYALGFALTLITGGRLGDRHGTKKLFVTGMFVFTAASLAAGLAGHVGVLVAARVVQGVGSGLMVPQVLSFIHAEFDERERPKAMTWYAAAFPVGGLAGPLLGGALTEADLFGTGWRAIFLVNLPIGVLALLGSLGTMPDRPGFSRHRMDPAGLALLTAALFAVFFPLVQGRELGWPAWSIALLVAAVPLFGGFALHQRRQFRRGGEPLVPPDLLRHLAGSQAVLLCVNTGVGVFFVLTLHLQLGLGFSPWEAALTFAPSTLGIVAGNVLSMRLAPRFGRAFTAAAVTVLLAGLAAIAVLVPWLGPALSGWALLVPVIAVGLGMGAVLNALFAAAMSGIRPEQAGAASGVVNTTVQLGTATGIALAGTVFFTRLDHGYASATTGALTVSAGVLVLALALTAVRQPSVPQSQAVG
ncbi:MFS transporter [Amycolatopsis balhimycina DSM 5908]|uniref:MFS transporter n=1 Tax=Amycolatopsis balhimycina DSM 5908 TaxID=1081091 RepID=A0A428W3P1_AMYBA|nr:MFS transporter [Amycolatopsis balhimycina]RSM37701.1 MFS transporter [Amycolatopsis balhimycina DSM 5908]